MRYIDTSVLYSKLLMVLKSLSNLALRLFRQVSAVRYGGWRPAKAGRLSYTLYSSLYIVLITYPLNGGNWRRGGWHEKRSSSSEREIGGRDKPNGEKGSLTRFNDSNVVLLLIP